MRAVVVVILFARVALAIFHEIEVTSWHDQKMPKEKVLCFYGKDEKEDSPTACVLPQLKGASIVERPGRRHFDGNYEVLAEQILKRLTGGK